MAQAHYEFWGRLATAKVTACDEVCKEVLGADDGIFTGCYHDTYNRPIYKPKLQNGEAQQINVKVGGEFLDIAAISPLVASAASFNIHRVYYDEQVESQGDERKERLQLALREKLQ